MYTLKLVFRPKRANWGTQTCLLEKPLGAIGANTQTQCRPFSILLKVTWRLLAFFCPFCDSVSLQPESMTRRHQWGVWNWVCNRQWTHNDRLIPLQADLHSSYIFIIIQCLVLRMDILQYNGSLYDTINSLFTINIILANWYIAFECGFDTRPNLIMILLQHFISIALYLLSFDVSDDCIRICHYPIRSISSHHSR